MNKWKKVLLSDFIQFKNGKKRPDKSGQNPVYGGNGILEHTNAFNYENSIIIGRVGVYCGCVYYEKNKHWVSDNAIAAINNNNSDIIFDYYLLRNLNLNKRHIGTGQPLLTQKILNSIFVQLPPLSEQKIIADTLSALDYKIKINNKINHHLEQMAQAIFKSWFIDFEPFGGVMPSDWREGTFSEVVLSTIGGDWGKDTSVGNNTQEVYSIRGADIPEVNLGNKGKMPIRYILPKNYAVKQLTVSDIVIEISGGSPTQSTGRCALITQSLLDRYDRGMVCTNFCKAVKPATGYAEFVYFFWKYLYERKVFFSYENGTTGIKNFDIASFLDNELIIIPPIEVAFQFASVVNEFIDAIFNNGLENEIIANLRDTLLPRLMSGELSVADLEIED